MPEVPRFAAGTRADAQQFNEWANTLATNQAEYQVEIEEWRSKLEELNRMSIIQGMFPPIHWTSASVNRIRIRGLMTSGNAEHSTRYCQIIQPLKQYIVKERSAIYVSKPVATGGPTVWSAVPDFGVCSGNIYNFEGTGDFNDAYVKLVLPTTRKVNCVVWEPFPANIYNLVSITLISPNGETAVDTSYAELSHHGPQRFFFPTQDVTEVEVKLQVFPAYEGNQVLLGAYKFEVAQVEAQTNVAFTFKVSDNTISNPVAYGQGSWTVTVNNPGQVDVVLRTPLTGPTSVIRQFSWSE